MANPKLVAPIPLKYQIADGSGNLTREWASWFRDVFSRVGGLSALSNTDLASSVTSASGTIAALQTNVTVLTASVATLQGQVTALQAQINGLMQGRQL